MHSDSPTSIRSQSSSSAEASELASETRNPHSKVPETDDPGYLTKRSIIQRIESQERGTRLIERGEQLEKLTPILAEAVGPWNYDLHLGSEVYRSTDERMTRLGWGDDVTIRSGEFGLLTTEEELNLPHDLAGFISLRFHVAVKGLVNISGRHVDPGYGGKIVFSVFNASPNMVVLKRGDPIFMITFAKLDHIAPQRQGGKVGRITGITSEMMESVKGQSISLQGLNERLATLELSLRKTPPELLDARLHRIEAFLVVAGALATVALGVVLTWYFGQT